MRQEIFLIRKNKYGIIKSISRLLKIHFITVFYKFLFSIIYLFITNKTF